MPWARMQMSNDGGRTWSDLEDPLHKMAEVEYEDASTDLTAPFRRAVENVIVQVGDSFRIVDATSGFVTERGVGAWR